MNGTAFTSINGSMVDISSQVAYATAYHNASSGLHPSEPNYLWAEAGTNFGVLNDNDPFAPNGTGTNQNTTQHLVGLLTAAGRTWKSYQEDIDLASDASGNLTNTPLPQDQWTVPLVSHQGFFSNGVNAYNGSNQFNYAAKHNPMVFFTDSNGGNDPSTGNPLRLQYAPLQQLAADLASGAVADYNWITPNQYNDMHTALNGGFRGATGDAANISQGDNFLSLIVPMIMASDAYKHHGAIIIWFDETEADGVAGDINNRDDSNHTIGEIVISPFAHFNVNGLPYGSPVNLAHSSDLRTLQKIFHVGSSFLGDAANVDDLSSLFQPGAVPRVLVPIP